MEENIGFRLPKLESQILRIGLGASLLESNNPLLKKVGKAIIEKTVMEIINDIITKLYGLEEEEIEFIQKQEFDEMDYWGE